MSIEPHSKKRKLSGDNNIQLLTPLSFSSESFDYDDARPFEVPAHVWDGLAHTGKKRLASLLDSNVDWAPERRVRQGRKDNVRNYVHYRMAFKLFEDDPYPLGSVTTVQHREYINQLKRHCIRVTPPKVVTPPPVQTPKSPPVQALPAPITPISPAPKRSKKCSSKGDEHHEPEIALAKAVPDMPEDQLPDFLPPRELFYEPQGLSKHLFKAKGVPFDNAHDKAPGYEHLTSTELEISDLLRLTPKVYLDCKRRIFCHYRYRTCEDGHVFRKTDAQKACRIDVTKTSHIWSWYEYLGLFKKVWNPENTASRPGHVGSTSVKKDEER